jgi:hypothetical protein
MIFKGLKNKPEVFSAKTLSDESSKLYEENLKLISNVIEYVYKVNIIYLGSILV